MRSIFYLLTAAGGLLFFAACTTNRFYTPNTVQVPMLSRQHQATITGGFSKSGKNSGWEAQGIYSPLPHVGLMVNHFNVRYNGLVVADFSPFFYESNFNGESRFTEAGVGGYVEVGPEKEYLLSLYTGFGQGSVLNRYSPPPDIQTGETYNSSWKYQRWFVQPSLSLKYRRFQVGTALRFASIDFYDGDINSRMGLLETERIQKLEASSPLFLTEMAWSIGWRLRPVVLSLNSTGVVLGNNSVRELELASHYVSFSAGLNIHELFKSREGDKVEKSKKKKTTKSKKSKSKKAKKRK